MTRRERLMKTLQGLAVDRPAVCFYEINGFDQDPDNPDPYNVYSDPSWRDLLRLARERTDVIARCAVGFSNDGKMPLDELTAIETWEENGSRFTRTTIRAGRRKLTSLTRRDRGINTVWTLEHFLKDIDDFRAWIELDADGDYGTPDLAPVVAAERAVGDAGLVMLDTGDPICEIAALFEMGDFTIVATTEPELMHRALEKTARRFHARTAAVAGALPGRLWRIFGPEYVTPPFLPPALFGEYVSRYDAPMVEAIQRHGGFARIHCHGKIRHVLDEIVSMGASGLDPIEPPHQGDVELEYVRKNYGRDMVLFGNIEITDIENLPTPEFERKVARALDEGTAGTGRGFVLMPSASPYGRQISERTLANYTRMVEMAENF